MMQLRARGGRCPLVLRVVPFLLQFSLVLALLVGAGCADWTGIYGNSGSGGDGTGVDDDDDDDDTGDDDTGDDDTGDDGTGDDDTGDDDTGDDDTGDDGSDDDDVVPGAVTCSPSLTNLSLTAGITQDVQLTASADGVPAVGVDWTVITGPGTVDASGLFTSSPDVGGEATVQAYLGGEVGHCIIEMTMDGDQNETSDAGLPGGFDSATVDVDDGCAAEILYPLQDSVMPGSFAPPVIQWQSAGHSHHALTLASQWTSVTVYLTGDSYTPSQEQWQGLTIYDPGDTVTISLVSGTWTGTGFSGQVCTASEDIEVDVVDATINGTIIYWATQALGASTKAISFDANSMPVNSSAGLQASICHGCHQVNLGNPMKMTYGPGMPGTTALVDLSSPATILQQWGGFLTMVDYGAPDNTGAYVVAGQSGFAGSALKLFSATSGSELGTITTAKAAAMPNWSPDGAKIVYVGCDGGASALGAQDCDLYTQDWDPATETFSNETLLASSVDGETLYYPSFSADSQWIAYNRAEQYDYVNSDGDTVTASSNNNERAKLMLIAASGGPQIELAQANGVGDLTNSWPRWAPVAGGTGWLAWGSKRAYGHTVVGTPQLWVSQIDFSLADAGADPSQPPVWIPGQLTSEGNHTPTWLPRYNN